MADTFDWNDETIAKLRELWAAGLSGSAIGLKMNISKSAVVGKAHRLNLPMRRSPIKRSVESSERKPRPPRRAKGATLPPLGSMAAPAPPAAPVASAAPPAPPAEPDEGASAPRAMLRYIDSRSACCWPIGEPGSKAFRYCADPIVKMGRPYCAHHTALSTVEKQTQVRQPATLAEIQAYAADHRVVVKPATGLSGLVAAVNSHRRMAGLTPYTTTSSA